MPQTASGKTMADLIQSARYNINDDSTPVWASDVEMLEWANEARFKVCEDGHALQSTENIDLIADTVEYTPVNNYIKIVAVQYIDESDNITALRPGSPSGVGTDYGLERPKFYYEFDGKLGVYPTLSTVTTQKVRVFEAAMCTDLASTDSVDTPAIFDAAIIKYIEAKFLWKDKRYASSAQAMADFEEELVKARIELTGVEK